MRDGLTLYKDVSHWLGTIALESALYHTVVRTAFAYDQASQTAKPFRDTVPTKFGPLYMHLTSTRRVKSHSKHKNAKTEKINPTNPS